MALTSSGQIDLNAIHVEAGGSSGSQAAMNDSDIRAMIGKGSSSQNAFNEYYSVSASAPSATYKGRVINTGNGFPSGYVTLSSGSKLVVVTLQLAGPGNTMCLLGNPNLTGVYMTLAAKQDTAAPAPLWPNQVTSAIYYAVSSLSGSVYITGTGGSGRSVLHVWEITGYNSSTPVSTASVRNTDSNSFSKAISLSTQYNGVTIGSGITEDTIPADNGGVTVSNSDSLQQRDLELATNHYTWRDENTPSGTRSYTCTNNGTGNGYISSGTTHHLTAAHWK